MTAVLVDATVLIDILRGRPERWSACLIAAAAFAVGGRLATGNPTAFPMPEISVEHWPSGQ